LVLKKLLHGLLLLYKKIGRSEKKNILKIDGTSLEGPDHSFEMMHDFITALWQKEKEKAKEKDTNKEETPLTFPVPPKTNNGLDLSEDEWKLMTKGAQMLIFNANEIIIKKGDFGTKVYQLVSGSATEESKFNSHTYHKDDLFGVTAFLNTQESSFDVRACERTQVIVIEGYYLNVLFQHIPSLAGRFFQHLTKVMYNILINAGYF